MNNVIYALIVLLVVVSVAVLSNRKIKNETPELVSPRPLSAAEMKAERERWEATPEGIKFKQWEASPAGKKVYAAEARIRNHISDSSNMEAIVTSLSLPPGSRLGFGVMVRISGEDYILGYGPEGSNEFRQLYSLKVDDKIIIRSRTLSHAPKYSYPIIWFDYVERDGEILYKRPPHQGGC